MQHLKSRITVLIPKSTGRIIPFSTSSKVKLEEISLQDKIAALTAKQLKLSERAGRTKRDSGMVSLIYFDLFSSLSL